MKKVIILHGTEGSPDGNWFRWLEAELRTRQYEVWLPQLPDSEQPSLHDWLKFIQAKAPFELDGDTTIIGHSSGAVLALLLAQQSATKLKSVICVSVFTNQCGESAAISWGANSRLFDVQFDWSRIKENVLDKIVLIHSDDDPYVPLTQAEYIASQVGAELIVITGQGHFNLEKSNEYYAFPALTELLAQKELL